MARTSRFGTPEAGPEVWAPAESPEAAPFAVPERPGERAAVEPAPATRRAPVPAPAVPSTPVVPDPILSQIEHVLEDGVFEAYTTMGPAEQQRFKTRGEQVSHTIRKMIGQGKFELKRVWLLIRDWLRLIPGVSQFFVEQEAKIKTDRMYALSQKQRTA